MRKAYGVALKKGVSCPDCGERLELPSKMPEGGFKGRFSCQYCEWKGSLLDTFEMGRMPDSPLKEKPVGSRIEKKGNRWVIPGTGKPNGEWFFSLVWLLFCFVFLGVVPFFGENGPGWFGVLFMVPFLGVGFWLLYLAARKTFRKIEVRINSADVKVTKRFLWMIREERVPRRKVGGVELDCSHDGENGRSFDLVIGRVEGDPLEVETEISTDEMRWLLGEWRETLGITEVEVEEENVKVQFTGKPIQAKGVELEPKENGVFFLTIRNRLAPWLIGVGAVMTIVGCAMVFRPGIGGGDGSGVFRFFDYLFTGIGFLFALIPLIGGMVALGWGLRTFGDVRKYVFYRDRIEFAKVKRGGRIFDGKTWSRSEMSRVVVNRTGESNGEPRYQVQMRGEENVSLVSFAPIEVAEELEGWIRNWLGAGENS